MRLVHIITMNLICCSFCFLTLHCLHEVVETQSHLITFWVNTSKYHYEYTVEALYVSVSQPYPWPFSIEIMWGPGFYLLSVSCITITYCCVLEFWDSLWWKQKHQPTSTRDLQYIDHITFSSTEVARVQVIFSIYLAHGL